MLRARQIDFFLCQRTWFAATLEWLNGVPASHTGICQTLPPAGLPKPRLLAGLGVTAWKPLAYPGHSWGSCPHGAWLSTEKKCSPEQKQKQTCARGSREEPVYGRNGVLRHSRAAHWSWWGGAGWVLSLKHGRLTSRPRITSIPA